MAITFPRHSFPCLDYHRNDTDIKRRAKFPEGSSGAKGANPGNRQGDTTIS